MDFAFLGAPLILNVNLRSLSSSVVVKYSRANFSVAPRNIGVQLKLESQCVTGTAPYWKMVKSLLTYLHNAKIMLPVMMPATANLFR